MLVYRGAPQWNIYQCFIAFFNLVIYARSKCVVQQKFSAGRRVRYHFNYRQFWKSTLISSGNVAVRQLVLGIEVIVSPAITQWL
jgi:hypothetical protein